MPTALQADSIGPVDVAVIQFGETSSTQTWLRRWPT